MRTSAAELLRAAEEVSDPKMREILRETALRAAIVDTSWSAAFVSYVIRQSGVAPNAFRFANAHRVYIYGAFAASAAELKNETSDGILAHVRSPPASDGRFDLRTARSHARRRQRRGGTRTYPGGTRRRRDARSVRRTHCEIVAHVDAAGRKVYTIGGNVNQSVTTRKLNLRRDLKFSALQTGDFGGLGQWTLPQPAAHVARPLTRKCSLNDKKWFVLLQLR